MKQETLEEPKQELSIRLENSLKQFNLSLEEALELEDFKLKNIGFGNRSIIELQSLKETLEEFINEELDDVFFTNISKRKEAERLIEIGAKWQQEQIGKSEFLQKLRATLSDAEARRLIFEQFKKK